jgi:hypothetical protein
MVENLKTPADNERFCESGGVRPPEHLCDFAGVPPAQAFVRPPPSQSRHHVSGNSGRAVRTDRRLKNF